MKKYYKLFLSFSILIILTAYISANYYQFALICGDSMNPTYHNMQLVILDKHTKNYQVGDVIAFHCDTLDTILFKRIVAVPEDIIQITDGTLYQNGSPASIPNSVSYNEIAYAGIAVVPITLSEDEYFVLGDNLSQSKDSRYQNIGCIHQASIIGKVILPH